MSVIKTTTLSTLDGVYTVPSETLARGACRAWVNFNGTGTVAIRASFNVSSITDNGTGDYTVNFANALPDADYSAVMTTGAVADVNETNRAIVSRRHLTTSVRAMTFVCSTAAAADMPSINISIFR
jgi:hypothetical protein